MALDNYYFETDTTFSTSHDFKVAQILANDLIQLYLENQLIRGNKMVYFYNKSNVFSKAMPREPLISIRLSTGGLVCISFEKAAKFSKKCRCGFD